MPKRNISNIDSIRYKREDGSVFMHIRGWCVLDDGDYALKLIAGGNDADIMLMERVKRSDVAKYLGISSENAANFGFDMTAAVSESLFTGKVRLKAEGQTGEQIIYSADCEDIIKDITENAISCGLNGVSRQGGQMVIDGWAVSESGRQLSYCLLDDKETEIKMRLTKTARGDIGSMFFGSDNEYKSGFHLAFPVPEGDIKLIISDGERKIQLPLTGRTLKKISRWHGMGRRQVLKLLLKARPKDIPAFIRGGTDGFASSLYGRYYDEGRQYRDWYEKHKAGEEELAEQKKTIFTCMPKISIVVPVYKTPEVFFRQMVQSVSDQSYENWELCIADGGEEDALPEKLTAPYIKDARIKYKRLGKNEGISGNTNRALDMATGDYVGFLDHDDVLTPDALFEVVKAINENEDADVIYSDEDKSDYGLTKFYEPHFKPDFNLFLLRTNNYICHFLVVKRQLTDETGGFDPAYDGSQDYDMILRCCEKAKNIVHIPRILYHWRAHEDSTAVNLTSKSYSAGAGKRAIEAHLERCGERGEVSGYPDHPGYYHVKYELETEPLVSVIILNRDEKDTLKCCIDSILEKTTYKNYEIVIVENNSVTEEIRDYYGGAEKDPRVRVITWEGEFNYSAINNFAAANCGGEYLLLLNNDVEVISEDWLMMMVADCMREDVGAVGAKLYYPDDTIQHAGVIVGIGGAAEHAFKKSPRNAPGYFMRACLQQELSAVTGACLLTKRSVFEAVGGLEESLQIAFNDVDYCLKVREKGYKVVFEPWAELYHYESKSRGLENTPERRQRFLDEIEYIQNRWEEYYEKGDPYYNPNLTLDKFDFSLREE